MNKTHTLKLYVFAMLFFLVLPGVSVKAVFSISSAAEFLSHAEGADTCLTDRCHAGMDVSRQYVHEPVTKGLCSSCHKADSYPDAFGINMSDRICGECHGKITQEVQASTFVHSPVKSGDCLSCHAPHASDHPFMLRSPYGELCKNCHKLERMFAGKEIHKPVKDGNCGLCHDPHASDHESRLTDFVTNLCIGCHDNMLTGLASEHIHQPVLEQGCTSCHDPHAGEGKMRIKGKVDDLCFRCHNEKKNEVEQYSTKHAPAVKGMCVSCHSPHFSERTSLLHDKQNELCYSCHKESRKRDSRKFKHGPVVQGNCSACHNPHGSDNPFILRLAFPHSFYSSYEKGKYDLCFLCHKEAIITSEKAQWVTNFRNGDTNLHWLHVNQKKGRTCRACHDVHASNQEGRIRDEFPFGKMFIPMDFYKTETGGSCIPGCHVERKYDRINRVINKK